MAMNILEFLPVPAGIVLLLFGRKMFWLLVAGVGFLAGYTLAPFFPGEISSTGMVIVGLVCGVVGALLALFAQKVALVVGGFLAGGYATMTILSGTNIAGSLPEWVPFLAGGLVGAILLRIVFEWALIVLTSMIGAILIVQPLDPGATILTISILILTGVGIVLQARSKKKQ